MLRPYIDIDIKAIALSIQKGDRSFFTADARRLTRMDERAIVILPGILSHILPDL